MLDAMDIYQMLGMQGNNSTMPNQSGIPQQMPNLAYQGNSPVMQMAGNSSAASSPSFEPTTGAKMEADSRSSIDSILARLQASQEANHQNDRNMQWMSFFSKLASSKNPSAMGATGEAADALTQTTGQQQQANKALNQQALQDELKTREWQQQQVLEQQKADQLAKYQQGELGVKNAALEQGKYTITPDGLGGFIKINNKTGETESVNNPITGGTMASATDKDGNPLTGDEYLKTLDPRIATTAKAVANGDMAWPGGFALKSPYWQNVIAAAQTYDPSANGNRFPAVKQFNTGKQGDQVRSFDVGVSHLDTLGTLADGLQNNDTPLINKASNIWKSQTGKEAPTDFNAAKNVVGSEIVKAIVGAGGGVADREKAQKDLDAANSPEQLRGVINTYTTLMKGQLNGLKQQYENSTGRKDFYQRLSPSSRTVVAPKDDASTTSGVSKTMHFNDLPE